MLTAPPPLPHSLTSRYDCALKQRGGRLFLRFDGYTTEEEEPLHDLAAVRFSSAAAGPADCPHLVPGTRVTAFKRSPIEDIWVDAELVAKRPGRHEGGKCSCRCALVGRVGGVLHFALHSWPLCASDACHTPVPTPSTTPSRPTHRSFTVKWLDTSDAGATADLRVSGVVRACGTGEWGKREVEH